MRNVTEPLRYYEINYDESVFVSELNLSFVQILCRSNNFSFELNDSFRAGCSVLHQQVSL